jgi:hypothetical protein
MASIDPTSPESFLLSVFPERELRRKGRLAGAFQRVRRIDFVALLLVVVFTVCGRGEQTIAEMRRELERRTGVLVARSAFWKRLSPALGKLVQQLLAEVLKESVKSPPELHGFLATFDEVIAVDGSVVQVDDSLADRWKGTGSASAVKVHSHVRPLTGELVWYAITRETRAECHMLKVNDDVHNKLYLLDRGYADGSLWSRIDQRGGFFLTRLKTSFTARIVDVNPGHVGSARKARGMRVLDLGRSRGGRRIDVQCEFTVRIRGYAGKKGRQEKRRFRVVGVWNSRKKRYHLYVTNVGPDRMTAEQVAATYRLRWDVERFFVCAKSGMGMDQVNSSKAHIVELFIRGALLRSTLAMQAKRIAERHLPATRWINPLLWIRVWRERIGDLLEAHLRRRRPWRTVRWARLAKLAVDPNRKRLSARVIASFGFAPEWPWLSASQR